MNTSILKRSSLIFAIILLAACNRPNPARPVNDTLSPAVKTSSFDETLTSGGGTRHYLLHVPATYQPSTPTPLVINFHGYNSNSAQEEALNRMSRKADQAGFLVVYPDGLNQTWYDGPGANGKTDQQFVRDPIQHLQAQYTIDSRRIYATGISNGGGMTKRRLPGLENLAHALISETMETSPSWMTCKVQ